MRRTPTNHAKDAKYFRDTASKMKELNLPRKGFRGGIKL